MKHQPIHIVRHGFVNAASRCACGPVASFFPLASRRAIPYLKKVDFAWGHSSVGRASRSQQDLASRIHFPSPD